MHFDCTLSGVIRDALDAPIAGTTLSFNGWQKVRSDADGRYSMPTATNAGSRPVLAGVELQVEDAIYISLSSKPRDWRTYRVIVLERESEPIVLHARTGDASLTVVIDGVGDAHVWVVITK